jgi:hypothetical protein
MSCVFLCGCGAGRAGFEKYDGQIQTCTNWFTGVIVLVSNGWWIATQHLKTKIQKMLSAAMMKALGGSRGMIEVRLLRVVV